MSYTPIYHCFFLVILSNYWRLDRPNLILYWPVTSQQSSLSKDRCSLLQIKHPVATGNHDFPVGENPTEKLGIPAVGGGFIQRASDPNQGWMDRIICAVRVCPETAHLRFLGPFSIFVFISN